MYSGTAWLDLLSRMDKTYLRCDSIARLTVYEYRGATCGRMRCPLGLMDKASDF